jgi:transcription-repair coupling factor (superfamily II helicase)
MRQVTGFDQVVRSLQRGDSANIDGAWGSSCALVAATLADQLGQRVTSAYVSPAFVIVLPRISEVDDFAVDLAEFAGVTPVIFPAWESVPRGDPSVDPVFGGRLRVLRSLSPSPPQGERGSGGEGPATPDARLIITCLPALLHPVPSRTEIERATRTVRVGDILDPEELLRWLHDHGCERSPAIESPGQFSMHGGIVDVFAPGDLDPIRIEFFGDEIESIRRFDVESQRKIADLTETRLTVASLISSPSPPQGERGPGGEGRALPSVVRNRGSETSTPHPQPLFPCRGEGSSSSAHFTDHLPPGSVIALVELNELVDEGRHYLGRLDNPRGFFSMDGCLAKCTTFPTVSLAALAADSLETTCHLQIESIERFEAPASQAIEELHKVVGQDERVLIACHNAGEVARLSEMLAGSQLLQSGRVSLCEGHLVRGFRLVGERLIVVTDHELFHRRDIRQLAAEPLARGRTKIESRAIDSFLELSPGDLVVHLTKGIARFRGMELMSKGEQVEEHLILEFRDGVKVFVPVSLIHLVQKYVGGTKGGHVTLSKVGSGAWERRKAEVAEAVHDLAADMIQLQAARESKPGIAFPPDSHWQQEFEASFPYTDTPDQVTATSAIRTDMQRPRPMDRLICGDVGYGKTELAMRAAFKAIDTGKQVAVLVPTTVLAEQHFRTFTERMAEFPFRIESLSRFKSSKEQRETIEGLKTGAVDIVIGTHRLISADVQFSDLGLLIIDEEQRFGVAAKEVLKRLRLELDVLTLSATPIPRTLHMSLIGVRDISNLQTPPRDRLSIETRIARFDGDLIRHAIIRELNRGGQVFFVHNRVYNIEAIADRLQAIVPEARIGIVHGQMHEDDLEVAMVQFVNGKTDILVATTIIESGLDIPHANTIFIHQANKYGLADLHQLRGRVGRYKHRAYCYLLLEEGKTLTSTAAKRLKAIEEFSELGAGFQIAMRDLEIRGAGNILGVEQSGHIAAVGYELYCQLLEGAVRRLKNEPIRELHHVAIDLPIAAFLPGSYVPPGRHKIDVYRKLSRVADEADLQTLRDELCDRFGPLPEEAARLIEMKHLQIAAARWQVDDIHLEEGFAVLGYRNPLRIKQLASISQGRLRVVDSKAAYLPIADRQTLPIEVVRLLKSLLQAKIS